jgi:prefoldin beta subunit
MDELSPQARHQLEQFQQAQQQAQALAAQRAQLQSLMTEVEEALEELSKVSEETPVYKALGRILIKRSRGEMEKELREEKETLELRIKVLSRQEERVVERMQEIRQKLQEMLKSSK